MYKIFLGVLVCCLVSVSQAQNTRTATVRKPPKPVYQSFKKEKKGPFSFLKGDNKKAQSNQSEVQAFRDRMQQVYKAKAKEQKLAKKKRYRKPGYFGHKRKPKKRPPGKQKFCEICRIKH